MALFCERACSQGRGEIGSPPGLDALDGSVSFLFSARCRRSIETYIDAVCSKDEEEKRNADQSGTHDQKNERNFSPVFTLSE